MKLGQAIKLCMEFDVDYFEKCVNAMRDRALRDGEVGIVRLGEALLAEMREAKGRPRKRQH